MAGGLDFSYVAGLSLATEAKHEVRLQLMLPVNLV